MPKYLSRRVMLTGGGAAALAPRAAHAGLRLVRFGQTNTAATPAGVSCHAFAAAVAADPVLQSVLRVEVHDNAALGDELSTVRGCMDGTIDMAVAATSSTSPLVPEVGLLDTPFLFKDVGTARAALDGAIGAEYAQVLKDYGINLLAWGENGLRHMTANRPIRRPEDLTGLKLRVPQSEVEIASFKALGADARPLAFPALYEALRTGEFDAQENPIGSIEASRFYEVQKVVSLTRHIYSAYMILVSQDLLDELQPEQQAALVACGRQATAVMRQVAETAERDGVARLRATGMQVVEDVDTAAFAAASRPNLTAMGHRYGEDRMARLIRAGAGA